jgi:proteasome lid subunit RPN8/RPN11
LEPIDAWDHPLAAELPVLIEQSVLVDVVAEARANPHCEVGGLLLGRVVRDNQNSEIFTVITGVASAHDTSESSNVSVTFTPASFLHARKLAVLRGASESICGWYHSHPFKLCAECPLPTPSECISKILFYSQDDVHLMETTFEQPYMVGLLAAIDPRIEQTIGHLPVRLYGWRHGMIQQRGFEVVRARTE